MRDLSGPPSLYQRMWNYDNYGPFSENCKSVRFGWIRFGWSFALFAWDIGISAYLDPKNSPGLWLNMGPLTVGVFR